MKSVILDFDGVIGNTFEAYSEYFSKIARISRERARLKLIQNGLTNKREVLLFRLMQSWYFKGFKRFLSTKGDLLFEDKLSQILSLEYPKAILSRSDSKICRTLLGDYSKNFEYIIGRDLSKNKKIGLEIITQNPKFDIKECVFVTDTVGDIKEMSEVLSIKQIYAVSWGFHSPELLEEYLPKEQIIDNFDFLNKKPGD